MADKNIVGMLHAYNMMCVQAKKNEIGENGDYFYNLGFSDGNNVLLVTAGKLGDKVVFGKNYNLHFDWIDKKLKLVYVDELSK